MMSILTNTKIVSEAVAAERSRWQEVVGPLVEALECMLRADGTPIGGARLSFAERRLVLAALATAREQMVKP